MQSACLAGTLAVFPSYSSPTRHIQLEGLAARKLFFVVFFLWEGLYILSLSFGDMVPLKKIRIPMAWVYSMGIQVRPNNIFHAIMPVKMNLPCDYML